MSSNSNYPDVMVQEILSKTKIQETPNKTLEAIIRFLAEPKSVAAMIMMTELGQPALSGVAKELEERFADSDFPLSGGSKNAANRRNIGWLVRYVLGEFGYEPKGQDVVREGQNAYLPRIGKFSGSKCFMTAAVYKKTDNPPKYSVGYFVE